MNEDRVEIKRVEEDSKNSCAYKDHEVDAKSKNLGRDPQEDHEHKSIDKFNSSQIRIDLFKCLVSILSNTSNYL